VPFPPPILPVPDCQRRRSFFFFSSLHEISRVLRQLEREDSCVVSPCLVSFFLFFLPPAVVEIAARSMCPFGSGSGKPVIGSMSQPSLLSFIEHCVRLDAGGASPTFPYLLFLSLLIVSGDEVVPTSLIGLHTVCFPSRIF